NLAVLIGLGVGFSAALALGMVELGAVRDADWIALVYPLRFGEPTFEPGAIASLCVVMIVVMVESTGLFFALGETCGKAVGRADIARGLAAGGLGAIIGGAFNAFPCAPAPQNAGLIAITGLRSRWVCAVAGAILVVVGLLPKLGAVFASLPRPVLGGAGLVMFGMVAATGIRILARVDHRSRHNLIVFAVSIAIGMIPMVAPTFFAQAPRWAGALANSGITLAAVSAVLLNALLNGPAASRRAGSGAARSATIDS
ncbi:MAG TPA: solute carrier family 23 protein, partial [Casimicrobiaceae bacterium]|nr:solute carrier family 23 protein [Casimicrobiaceae bacterium]